MPGDITGILFSRLPVINRPYLPPTCSQQNHHDSGGDSHHNGQRFPHGQCRDRDTGQKLAKQRPDSGQHQHRAVKAPLPLIVDIALRGGYADIIGASVEYADQKTQQLHHMHRRKAPSAISQAAPANIIRDMYMLGFLDLPEPYREYDLKKAILKNMKKFLLEIGRDFIFMGEEYHLQVGKNDYYTDLIFFHRELQCLVAIELKIDDFKPEYLGKMQFYLEALDRDVKKPHENPSVGIILCKSKDEDVVEYALSRNMSPTMISEYRTKLISKEILQKKLEELTEMVNEDKNSQ